jgi:hypothetical protein
VGQQPFSSIIGSATPRGVGVPGPLGSTFAVVDGDLALGATRSTLAQTSNRTVTFTAAAPRLWDGIEIPQFSDSSPTKIDSVYTDPPARRATRYVRDGEGERVARPRQRGGTDGRADE